MGIQKKYLLFLVNKIPIYILFDEKRIYQTTMVKPLNFPETHFAPGWLQEIILMRLSSKDILPYLYLEQLSSFSKAVLSAVLDISSGNAAPYSQVANHIGKPKAVRAVGSSLAKNPIPYIIPCHRIIKKNRQIGCYIWGSEIKSLLLVNEKNNKIQIDIPK